MTSGLALFGDKVFPIQTNEEGILTVAGAEYGKVDLTNPFFSQRSQTQTTLRATFCKITSPIKRGLCKEDFFVNIIENAGHFGHILYFVH